MWEGEKDRGPGTILRGSLCWYVEHPPLLSQVNLNRVAEGKGDGGLEC